MKFRGFIRRFKEVIQDYKKSLTLGLTLKFSHHGPLLNLHRKSRTYSFLQIVKGEYKTWIIYLVMEYGI